MSCFLPFAGNEESEKQMSFLVRSWGSCCDVGVLPMCLGALATLLGVVSVESSIDMYNNEVGKKSAINL